MLTPHVGWEDFPDSDNEEEVKCYVEMLAERAMQLDQLVISNIGDYEQRQRHLRRGKEPGPTMVYGFEVGQTVLRHLRQFSKLDVSATEPAEVMDVQGLYNQRIKIKYVD